MGPFLWVRILAESLRVGPGDEEMGQYGAGYWHIGNNDSMKLQLHGSNCSVRFEGEANQTKEYGPFEEVASFYGAIYTQPGRVLLALLNEENNLWYEYDRGRSWPGLFIGKYNEKNNRNFG